MDTKEYKFKTDNRSFTLQIKHILLIFIPAIAICFEVRKKKNETFSEWIEEDYLIYVLSFMIQIILYILVVAEFQHKL